jgi:hypothetical protein
MVDASDFLGPDEFAEDEIGEPEDGSEAEDLAALKGCLQALADAIASTNLAVIMSVQNDGPAATSRVQASIGALKRFHDAFAVLKAEPGEAEEEDED